MIATSYDPFYDQITTRNMLRCKRKNLKEINIAIFGELRQEALNG
jgi:hypothetical protein